MPGVHSVRSEFLVFGRPVIGDEEAAEVADTLRSGWIGTGPKTQRFERMLRDYLGAEAVRCVSSCTAALTLGIRALELGEGAEVIAPTLTFVASIAAIVHAGARPVLVDSDPATGLMDLDAAEAAVTERTRAIMPVHLAGRPVDLDRVGALARRHDLAVVEDAAHAIGAEWRGQKIGGRSRIAAFSFHATKNMTTGEGGAIATDDPELAARVEQVALHGLSVGAWQRFSDRGYRHYEATRLGSKSNMTDMQASLGIHQLPRLDRWIARREELWRRYDSLLAGLPLTLPAAAGGQMRHARHLYQVLIDPGAGPTRDGVLDSLTDQRIGTGVHYRAVHLHPYYAERLGHAPSDFPVASDISERTLSLPLSPGIDERDQDDVAAALEQALMS